MGLNGRNNCNFAGIAGEFMTVAVTQALPSYLKLVRKFPLRVIGSEAQYDAAIAVIQYAVRKNWMPARRIIFMP